MPPPTVPEKAAEEILEQIFLRLPVNEPACLVRASLAKKHWLALLTSARFRSRYREHHGPPPMLGFLTCTPWDSTEPEEGVPPAPPFVSTATEFHARVPDDGWGHRDYTAWDCRHGRVLLGENNASLEEVRRLAVWDPMTGRRWELMQPDEVYGYGLYAAAVLCAVRGCDHLACSHDGPFQVIHLSLHGVAGDDLAARARVATSADFRRGVDRSELCPGVSVGGNGYIEPRPPVLLNGALHFLLAHDSFDDENTEILKYDLSSHSISLIDAPEAGRDMASVSVLMAMEDGNLGFAHLKNLTLFIWSRHVGSDGVAAWTRRRVIDIKSLQPIQNPTEDNARLLGSMEGSDVVFVATYHGIYKVDTKSLQHEKISNGEYLVSLIPYTSFKFQPSTRGARPCDARGALTMYGWIC